MVRANRYVTSTALDVNAYLEQFHSDEVIERHLQEQAEQEALWLEDQYGENSRTHWLMENDGLSLIDACIQVDVEEANWRKETFAWLQDPKNQSSEIYSDVYKDYYGVRPH